MRQLIIETYTDKAGERRWRAIRPSPEGEQIVCDSGEGYKSTEHMVGEAHGLFAEPNEVTFREAAGPQAAAST